jgi:hypothetical protein
MPKVEKLVCSKCGAEVEPEPELGDRQGCERRIVHGATTWQLVLCSECAKPLFELYGDCVDMVLPEGTAQGVDKLDYLPVRRA